MEWWWMRRYAKNKIFPTSTFKMRRHISESELCHATSAEKQRYEDQREEGPKKMNLTMR
jgi:hypothetical protein